MKLNEYFAKTQGTGVLATADAQGVVDVALYSRPHFPNPDDENTVAFLMADRLSHANLQANPHAAYLFLESGKMVAGTRLVLTRTHEETDAEKINAIGWKNLPPECQADQARFLVYFKVDQVRPLTGAEETKPSH